MAAQMVAKDPPQTEGGKKIVKAFSDAEQSRRVDLGAENYNLANDMDDGMRNEIAQEVVNGYQDDEKSRIGWLGMHKFWLSLYHQQDHAENADPNRSWGATESVPILTESCNQFQARTYKIFFPNLTFVSARNLKFTKDSQMKKILDERAERVGRHMSYQLGVQDKSYKPNKDGLFLGVALHGSFFTKTYLSNKTKKPRVDNVRPTDLVINHTCGPILLDEVRRKTHVIHTTVGDTQDMAFNNFLLEEARGDYTGKNEYDTKVMEIQGLVENSSNRLRRDMPCTLLEQHFFLDLDDSGFFKPYIGVVDLSSRKLLRLTIGYEAESNGTPIKDYEQMQYFTHYKFMEDPDGFYGLGLGHVIGDLNGAVNIGLRQSIDAATLANDGNCSGFMDDSLAIEGDEVQMILGKFRKISAGGQAIQNGIHQFRFPGPNEAYIKLLEWLDARAQRLGATTEATTGASSRAEQPTTLLAQIEQSLEMFSSVQMRLANSLGDELQKVYRLNQKYLPLIEYFTINDTQEVVTRADYADDMTILPVFDPKFATQQQKVARAQAELQMTLQNPINQTRPQVIDAAFRRALEAMEVDNIDEILPPPPEPENFNDQQVENMFFLMPQESRPLFDVFPEHNHRRHLSELEDFVKQFGEMLLPDQQEAILKHQMKHQAFLYGVENGIIPEQQAEQRGAVPMAAGTGNAMGFGGVAPQIPGANFGFPQGNGLDTEALSAERPGTSA